MSKAVIIVLLNLVLLAVTGNSQSLNFKTYTASDGLVANPIRCVYQDSKGFIWIGTYDGLSRYDGFKFTNYTTANGLSHNFINSIIEINGRLLIAQNNGGIDVFENGKIVTRYKLTSAANSFVAYDNRLMISTDSSGFFEYKDDKIVRPAQKKTGTPLGNFISFNDSMLLGDAADDKLVLFKKDFLSYSLIKKVGVYFYSLFRDSKQTLWACTSEGLKLLDISLHEGHTITFSPLPSLFNFPTVNDAAVTSMIEDSDGSFWIGTLKGLVHISPNGNYHIYNEKDGLPSSSINSLYRDKENNLWIGTSLGLVKWVSKNHVTFYNTENKQFKNDVVSIYAVHPEKILLRTDLGLQYFLADTKRFVNIDNSDNQAVPYYNQPTLVHSLQKTGRLDSALNRIVPVNNLGGPIPGVLYAVKQSNEIIFMGGFAGLFVVERLVPKNLLPHRTTSMVMDKNNTIWAGTWQDGLFRITIKNNDTNTYEIREMSSLIQQKQIRGLFADSKNNIWVATRYGGVYCLTPKGTDEYTIQHFSRQSGLMSDWAVSFAETKTGDIWVGTYLGLDKLVKESSGYRVFNFSKAVNFFAEIKAIVPVGSDQWVCLANRGIAHFKDENIQSSAPLRVTLLSSSHGVLDNKVTYSSPKEKTYLKSNQNTARFEFSALGFTNERQIQYSYRLRGSSDTSWTKPENIHEAFYASLSPGHYTFEVRTMGWNGEPGEATAYSFTIATPFWKQWWFIGLCIMFVGLLIYAFYRYRIRQVIRLQHVRNSIATDLHDEIGSALTNISILAELSRNKNQQRVFTENLPGRISEESTLAQQALDDIIWSVNSNNDNLNQTMARMRRYTAEVFEPAGIDFTIDFANIPGDLALNMEQRKDIYLAFKECLNNIIKHATAKNAFIKINVEKNILQLTIKDDGNGFDPLQQTDRNGLKNIRTRIQRWHGTINIISSPGQGTMVDCRLPLASPK